MPDPRPAALPDNIAAAVRQTADDLFQTLTPAMTTASPATPQIIALWQMAKMLSAVSGGLDFSSVPETDLPRAQWEEAAELASAIANDALTIAATGMSPEQAGNRVLETDVDMYDSDHTTAAYAGAIELTPPDWQETTHRTLTVTVRGDQHRTLSVTTDRGPAPTLRPHTAATLLRTAHHLHQLGATLGELVPEPPDEGKAHEREVDQTEWR